MPKDKMVYSIYSNLLLTILTERRHQMKLVVTIPSYNEERSLGSVIREIPKTVQGIDGVEILVINDGSTDRTVEAAKNAGANLGISRKM